MMYLFGSSILISVKGAISSHLSKVVMEKWPNKWPSVYYKNLNCMLSSGVVPVQKNIYDVHCNLEIRMHLCSYSDPENLKKSRQKTREIK